MSVLDVRDVSIVYRVGDFKDIGLKDWVVKKLKGTYFAENFYGVRRSTGWRQSTALLSISPCISVMAPLTLTKEETGTITVHPPHDTRASS